MLNQWYLRLRKEAYATYGISTKPRVAGWWTSRPIPQNFQVPLVLALILGMHLENVAWRIFGTARFLSDGVERLLGPSGVRSVDSTVYAESDESEPGEWRR